MEEEQGCELCKETSCVLSGDIPTNEDSDVGSDGNLFADLRLDLDDMYEGGRGPQLDIEFGWMSTDMLFFQRDWTPAIDITFCPFCGRRLRFDNHETER